MGALDQEMFWMFQHRQRQELTGLGFLPALCGKEEHPMTPRFELSCSLCLVLSMGSWAVGEGSPLQQEVLWHELMMQEQLHGGQWHLAKSARKTLALRTIEEPHSEDPRFSTSVKVLATDVTESDCGSGCFFATMPRSQGKDWPKQRGAPRLSSEKQEWNC